MEPPRPSSSIRYLGLATAAATLALLAAGAVVNSAQAALSVPDWPRSFGRWILVGEWTGNTVYEHTHRLLAALTGLLLGPYLWLSWGPAGAAARRVIAAIGVLFVTQVLMGGAVVLLLDPPWLAIPHLLVAQTLTCLVLGLALAPWGIWSAKLGDGSPRRRDQRLARWLVGLLVLQVVLGALSRHPTGQTDFIVSLLGHLATGLAIVLLAPAVVIPICLRCRGLTRWVAATLGLLLVLQTSVAVSLLVVSPEPLAEEWPPPDGFVPLHTAHVTIAALLVLTAVVLSVRIARQLAAPPSRPV